MKVLVMLCLPLVTLADTAEGSLGALCGSKKNGIFASAPCKTELSCQQWVNAKGQGAAWYCLPAACLGEDEVASENGERLGLCCDGLTRQNRKCVTDWPAAFISQGLVPSKIDNAPPPGLSTSWPCSGLSLSPDMSSVDSGDMAMRPTLEWPVEEGALYTVMMLDTGIERLEGLQYIHWMVENIPGNEVSLGDEVYEYVPPFHFEIGADGSLLDDGTAGGPILTLVYKQSSRIAMTQRQSGCNAGLATRIGDKTALAAQYNLSSPVAGNFLYTVYSEATDPLLCRFTRCSGAPFPLPVAGVNDGPECTA